MQKSIDMHSYPRNSPEAAARIVALVLVSDGHVSRAEYEALSQPDGILELGLAPHNMPGIIRTLCEDLLMEGFDGRSILSHVNDDVLVSFAAEVTDPTLQSKVLRVAASVAQADRYLSDGESAVLDAIGRYWQSPVRTRAKDFSAARCSPAAERHAVHGAVVG